ncbi:MAG: hypothetical protein ACI9FR_000787 [Cryomorphaceae bacterium]|jgi:hypothetical protein
MKVSRILSVVIVALISFNASAASERYTLKSDAPSGSKIRAVEATSPIPFNKSYVELSNDQQSVFKAQYQNLSVDAQPPFPVEGLGAIYRPILKKNKSLENTGVLSLAVLVDEKGRVDSVSVVETTSPELEQFAVEALAGVEFEPAVCDGATCSMEFPVKIILN